MIHWTRGRKNKYEKEEYCCVSVTAAVIWEEIKPSNSFHQAENGFSLTPNGHVSMESTRVKYIYSSKVHLLKHYIIYSTSVQTEIWETIFLLHNNQCWGERSDYLHK